MATIRRLALLLTVLLMPMAASADEDGTLADQARAVLKQYCHRCHGAEFQVPRFDVLDRDILTAAPAGKKKKPYVVPGKPDDSFLWQRAGVDQDMPPEDPTPTDAERAILRRWIEAGAPMAVLAEARPFVGEAEILAALRDDLSKAPSESRPFFRYFTLANLHNNRKVPDDDVRLARAALAKLLNSLSWKPRIVVPRAIDANQVVLAIDLRDLGWDARTWRLITQREQARSGSPFAGARDPERKGYPYGLTHLRDRDEPTGKLAEEVYRLSGCQLPYLRADWFVATASRPPLYEAVLGLPANARELERKLDVDVVENFLRDRLARAAFATSGVSSHNRMIERHEALYGAYWKSYDFKSDEDRAGLPRFPLGPLFAGNPFERQAFEHAGGEIIFHLPNGLQAYLLVDNQDRRIEAGPIEIVGDSLRTSGTATVVNGLSCMACHKNGMIAEFRDEIRAGNGLAGESRAKVERLYPEPAEMERLLGEDENRFLTALEKATGAFLKVGPDRDKAIREFPEPIGAVARRYVKDLALEDVAAELGLEDPAELAGAIKGNPELRRQSLGPLLDGGSIKRSAWESLKFFNAPYQDAALQLERGTPYHEL